MNELKKSLRDMREVNRKTFLLYFLSGWMHVRLGFLMILNGGTVKWKNEALTFDSWKPLMMKDFGICWDVFILEIYYFKMLTILNVIVALTWIKTKKT